MKEQLKVSFKVTETDIRDVWDTPEIIKSRNDLITSILEWECEDDTAPDRLERLKEMWLIKTDI